MTTNTPHITSKECWVVSDGRRGIENQALGLAEAVAITLEKQGMSLQIDKAIVRKDGYVTLPDGMPDLWIGCGRAAISMARRHQNIFPDTFFAYVQDPRKNHDIFDLIISPSHDRLTGGNVVNMIGSPNRVTQSVLDEALLEFTSRIDALPGKRAAILIGGDSKRFKMDAAITTYLIARLQSLLDQSVTLMITVSRRTPKSALKALKSAFGSHDKVWFFDGEGDNPYFAFLAAADWIFVTEESTNMLVEASSTGKPVYALPMAGNPGKFSRLHSALEAHGSLRPYLGQLESWDYSRLDETHRVAQKLLSRWQSHLVEIPEQAVSS